MEKAKRFLAQFLVFMFWSAVATTIGLLVVYHFKHNTLPPAWRWWDVLGFSVVSAAIIMTGKSIMKIGNDFRFWSGARFFFLWIIGLTSHQSSVWIFNQTYGTALIGLFLLFLIPSGLGVILIMAFGHKNIYNSTKRAIGWLLVSVWSILLIFISSLAVAKGFNFVFSHLGRIVGHAISAVSADLCLVFLMMLIVIFFIKGLIALHQTAFKKESGINKK